MSVCSVGHESVTRFTNGLAAEELLKIGIEEANGRGNILHGATTRHITGLTLEVQRTG